MATTRSGDPKRAAVFTIKSGISRSLHLYPAKFAENARSTGKSRFVAILGRFRLEKSAAAVGGRATKMAIARSRGPKTRGTFYDRMRNFTPFDVPHRNC